MGQNMWTWQPRVMCVLKTHNYLFQSSSAVSKEGQKIGKNVFLKIHESPLSYSQG